MHPRVRAEDPSEGLNPRETGEYGICYVRNGKATTGSAPKPRSVLTVWGWVPEILEEWILQFRPLLAPPGSAALWPSERAARVGLQLNSRFAAYRDALGLSGRLDFHSRARSEGHSPHLRLLRQFAIWQQLPRLRAQARRRPLTASVRQYASDQLTQAHRFLGWLAQRDHP